MPTGWTHTRWMTALPDDIPISELNIPGAHNAAAINKIRSTRWACQCHSITEQLERGIRLLDIRLKPKLQNHRSGPASTQSAPPTTPNATPQASFIFQTCHGHLGVFAANEFQRFDEVQKECIDFLNKNPGETIIMTIRIDDWRDTRLSQRPHILQNLHGVLSRLPLLTMPHLPTLGECRGRVYLINRINDDPALGVPLNIPDNNPGVMLKPTTHRHYPIYIQDQYKALSYRNPEAHKLTLTLEAFKHKKPNIPLLNFASATKPLLRFVCIMRDLLNHFGQSPHQNPTRLGWLFLDYTLTTYVTDAHETIDVPTFLIAANFNEITGPFTIKPQTSPLR